MSRTSFFAVILVLLLAGSAVHAADQSSNKVDDIISAVEKNKTTDTAFMSTDVSIFRTLQEKNKIILLVCIIGVSPLFLLLILTNLKKTDHAADHIVNASALVLVIQATTFIVIAAPTSEQLTAAIGVLGAIAGYIFGTSTKRGVSEGTPKPAEDTKKGLGELKAP